MTREVAIIGSSGGNLYSLGGKNPFNLLDEIKLQLEAAGIEVGSTIFLAADRSLDKSTSETNAKLITYNNGNFNIEKEGPLEEVNILAKELDNKLAEEILNKKIDGLVSVSADPQDTNIKSIKAGAAMKIPATGTGGTSVANAQALGLNVISASGTTGSTNRTRAVSYAAGFANHWGLDYKAAMGGDSSIEDVSNSPFERINFRGIMIASLPAFVVMAISIALSNIPGLQVFENVFEVILNALPVVVAAIAAKQVSGYDEVGILSGVVAGSLAAEGGILGGVIGGILAGVLVSYIVDFTTKKNYPATVVNILAGGFSGLIIGLIMYFGFSQVTAWIAQGIQNVIEIALGYNTILAGALAGLLMWPAILAGIYHGAILPLMLLEMEQQGHSFLAGIDSVALWAGAIGITLGVIVFSKNQGDKVAAGSGLFILGVFGTFVEAAYPYMFSNKKIFTGAIIAGGVGGAVAGYFSLRTTPYAPVIMGPFLSTSILGWFVSMLTSIAVSFIITGWALRTSKKPFNKQ